MVIFTQQECEYIKSFYHTEIEHSSEEVQDFGKVSVKFSNSSANYISSYNTDLITFLENKLIGYGIKSIPKVKFIKYNVGDNLARHTDFTKYGAEVIFKTYLFQLSKSDEYTGGDLIVGTTKQSREQGAMCVINPTTPHEVTTVLSGERMSLVIFLLENNLDIPKTII